MTSNKTFSEHRLNVHRTKDKLKLTSLRDKIAKLGESTDHFLYGGNKIKISSGQNFRTHSTNDNEGKPGLTNKNQRWGQLTGYYGKFGCGDHNNHTISGRRRKTRW